MRLEGSLDAFSLPDIFALLSMTKKTGGLHLRRPGAHGIVWFTTGSITGGSSNADQQGLARRLIGAGAVGEEALAAAVQRAAGEDIGIARALQQADAIDDGALHDLVSEQLVDVVFDLMRWPEGDFEFVIDEPNPDDVGVSRQADDVVTEARRRLDVWNRVAATVPSPQTILSLVTSPTEPPEELTRDEWALLALVDGRRTVSAIVELSGRGDFAVVSALADLVERNLVRQGTDDGVSTLLRQHQILARLERGAAPPAPAAPTTPPPSAAPVAPAPRAPEQRTDPTPMPVAVGASSAPAAAPARAAAVAMDPDVNKSLMLRLIAGVRGL